MRSLKDILADTSTSTIISELKERSYQVPAWTDLVKDYEPELHTIVNDRIGRKDKVHSDGTMDKAARIPLALEKLLTKRVTDFTFAIQPKRVYSNADTDTRKAIVKAMESVYKHAHIEWENIKRGVAYYASCEIFTLWYVVEKPNTLYGFNSKFKLKCRTFSPMDGSTLYPLFDETGDLLAISLEYTKKVANEEITFFETYTAEEYRKWKSAGKDWEVVTSEPISILKIPGAYLWRKKPIFAGLQKLREDLEYTLSRNSDIVAYNSAPILKVVGKLEGEVHKGETRRVYRVTEGGDVGYVSWMQSVEAQKFHTDSLMKHFWMQSQMPDISFENLKSLGNIGYSARKMLLTDTHLKIGEEKGAWLEFLNRESNVIKAFLKQMNVEWKDEVDEVQVEHIITPFIIEDEQEKIDMHMKANGGKPVESQRESIQYLGKSANVDETIRQINEEADATAARSAQAFQLE